MKNIIYKIFIKQTYLRGGHCEGIFNIYNNICHNTYISRIFCKKYVKSAADFLWQEENLTLNYYVLL